VSNQTQPGWEAPTEPSAPRPPKPKRQFLVTKIAVGVAAGIALFIVGMIVLVAVLISGSSTGSKQTTVATPTTADFSAPASTPTDTTPDVTEPPANTPSDLAAGDTGSFTSDAGAGDITVTKIQAATRDPGEFGERAKHGWYVVIHLKATGTSGSYDVNSFDFYAKASNGYHTEDAEYLESWGPALDGGTLHSGEHISGTIVYDMPTKHGKLVYSPNLDGEPLATWSY
jgi:predicted secreted protein